MKSANISCFRTRERTWEDKLHAQMVYALPDPAEADHQLTRVSKFSPWQSTSSGSSSPCIMHAYPPLRRDATCAGGTVGDALYRVGQPNAGFGQPPIRAMQSIWKNPYTSRHNWKPSSVLSSGKLAMGFSAVMLFSRK